MSDGYLRISELNAGGGTNMHQLAPLKSQTVAIGNTAAASAAFGSDIWIESMGHSRGG